MATPENPANIQYQDLHPSVSAMYEDAMTKLEVEEDLCRPIDLEDAGALVEEIDILTHTELGKSRHKASACGGL
ncbi:uncharacterized protein ColSpa_11733 [Colletotrichum spaethianum]|uniref:Uncharacterized protein n=1 Tax=Colletotrichum spaethianum TaxID=700344 RepID=A0AA37PG64_9PEZI|nr:uncharacterized protein ColSpa_11733 [Colletotrichum spaethianum]GKT51552.1 hypothetical protein ColSpa_11733 [Colletotrichum spaethianum]